MGRHMTLEQSVRRKFKTDERVAEWWVKYNYARRYRLRRLFNQQNGQCCYCARQCWMSDDEVKSGLRSQATVEHKIPVSLGGSDHPTNTLMACKRCNTQRGTIDFNFYMNLVKTGTVDQYFGNQARHKGEQKAQRKEESLLKSLPMVVWAIHHSSDFKDQLESVLSEMNG